MSLLRGLAGFICSRFLGIMPQAMAIPPLRGFTRPPHEDGGDPEACRRFAARRISFVAGRPVWRPRLHISPLRGSGRSKANRSAEAKSTWCRIVIEDERRRRDRFIAWGVSPRNKDAPSLEPWRGDSPRKRGIQFHSAPKGATDLWNGASTRDPKHLADAWPGVRAPGMRQGAIHQAAKRRQTISLGREPQDQGIQ